MSERINHWCIICGKGYHACDSCSEIKEFKPWRTVTDTVQHYQIYAVIKEYNGKLIDKKEAKTMLNNIGVDLKQVSAFKEDVRNVLNEILREEKTAAKSAKKTVVKPNSTDDNTKE